MDLLCPMANIDRKDGSTLYKLQRYARKDEVSKPFWSQSAG